MINFIDIDTGNTFNGNPPYIFWFDNGQSTNINYIRKICIISDLKYLNIKTDSNYFSLIDTYKFSEKISVNDFYYYDLSKIKSNKIRTVGYSYKYTDEQSVESEYFIHMLYILGFSSESGEFIDEFTIEENTYKIGADFYDQNEILTTNLSNFEEKIPESFQKSLYDTNVHEEANDNIILNRKYKELLLNYWNIVASKGSYKSLLDSLNWFEYGDLLKIKEYWTRKDPNCNVLLDNDLTKTINNSIKERLSTISKTTHLGIYLATRKLTGNYEDESGVYTGIEGTEIEPSTGDTIKYHIDDSENFNRYYQDIDGYHKNLLITNDGVTIDSSMNDDEELFDDTIIPKYPKYHAIYNEANPELENVIFKWTWDEMSLKMTLLGNFFSTYFMPIHLDLIHSTIESIVFANIIKIFTTSEISINSFWYNTNTFKCTIESDFKISNNTTFSSSDSLFEDFINSTNKVSEIIKGCILQTESATNIHQVPCCVIKFNISIPDDSSIKYSKINIRGTSDYYIGESYNYVSGNSNNINFEFYLSISKADKYDLNLQFNALSGHIYSKNIKFEITDSQTTSFKLYYIRPIENDEQSDEKLLNIYTQLSSQYEQYLPNINIISGKLRLNHVIIIDEDLYKNYSLSTKTDYSEATYERYYVDSDYDEKTTLAEKHHYKVYISKKFTDDPTFIRANIILDGNTKPNSTHRIVDEDRFIIDNHKLVEYDGETVNSDEVLCIIPTNISSGLEIDYCDWEFYNVSSDTRYKSNLVKFIDSYYLNNSGKNNRKYSETIPFFESYMNGGSILQIFNGLDSGYYDVIFKYKLEDKIKTIERKSLFKLQSRLQRT